MPLRYMTINIILKYALHKINNNDVESYLLIVVNFY